MGSGIYKVSVAALLAIIVNKLSHFVSYCWYILHHHIYREGELNHRPTVPSDLPSTSSISQEAVDAMAQKSQLTPRLNQQPIESGNTYISKLNYTVSVVIPLPEMTEQPRATQYRIRIVRHLYNLVVL